MQELVQSFGPIAFGVLALLVIWRAIVKPELDRGRVEVSTMAKTMTATTAAMDALVTRLERLAERMEGVRS